MKYVVIALLALFLLAGCAPTEEIINETAPEPIEETPEPTAPEPQPEPEEPEGLIITDTLPEEAETTQATTWITDLSCGSKELIFTWNNIRTRAVNASQLMFHANGVVQEPACELTKLEARTKTTCTLNESVYDDRLNVAMIIDENRVRETAKIFCE